MFTQFSYYIVASFAATCYGHGVPTDCREHLAYMSCDYSTLLSCGPFCIIMTNKPILMSGQYLLSPLPQEFRLGAIEDQ